MRLGLLSDLHCELVPARQRSWINPYEPLQLERRLRDAIEIFSVEQPDIVVLLGDTSELGDREAFDFVFSRLRRLTGAVLATVAGNHDGGADTSALAISARTHGVRLLNGESMYMGGVTIIGLGVAPVAPGLSVFRGAMPDWPREGLLTVVASHFPLLSHALEIAGAGLPYSGDIVNRGEIEALPQQSGIPTVVLSGHVHSRCTATAGHVLQLTVGAVIEPPFDCTVVDIDIGTGIAVRRRAFTLGDAPTINPVFSAADERWRWHSDRWQR
ncbi:MAG TPA: metallophosphoesterase [Gemmatimonadaceae bacterium]|jgi:hypothetical protein